PSARWTIRACRRPSLPMIRTRSPNLRAVRELRRFPSCNCLLPRGPAVVDFELTTTYRFPILSADPSETSHEPRKRQFGSPSLGGLFRAVARGLRGIASLVALWRKLRDRGQPTPGRPSPEPLANERGDRTRGQA